LVLGLGPDRGWYLRSGRSRTGRAGPGLVLAAGPRKPRAGPGLVLARQAGPDRSRASRAGPGLIPAPFPTRRAEPNRGCATDICRGERNGNGASTAGPRPRRSAREYQLLRVRVNHSPIHPPPGFLIRGPGLNSSAEMAAATDKTGGRHWSSTISRGFPAFAIWPVIRFTRRRVPSSSHFAGSRLPPHSPLFRAEVLFAPG